MSHISGCRLDGPPEPTAILRQPSHQIPAEVSRCLDSRTTPDASCAVMKCTEDVIIWTDSAGKIASASPSVQHRWGYLPNELLGRQLEKILAWDVESADAESGSPASGVASANGVVRHGPSGRCRVRCRNGETYVADIVCAPVGETDAERSTILMFHDLTETVQREEALRESEERFSKAFECSPTAISISTASDGRYVDVNSAFLRLLGFDRNEVVGHTASELRIWASHEARSLFAAEVSRRGRITDCDALLTAKSGEVKQVVIAAEVIQLDGQDAILAVTQDVTAAKILKGAIPAVAKDGGGRQTRRRHRARFQ